MGRVVLARSVSIGIAFVLVSLLPLHPDTRIPATPACPADRAEMCRMKHAECPELHPPRDPPPATAGCAAEYAVRCRAACGDPVPTGGYARRLRELGPWWMAALPGGPEAWASLRGRLQDEASPGRGRGQGPGAGAGEGSAAPVPAGGSTSKGIFTQP